MFDETLTKYLNEIGKHPLLTTEEEQAATQDQLIKSNLKLVVHVAKRYNHNTTCLLDTIQDGNEGLIKAAQRYDPKRGKFSVCATYYIKAAIRQARRNTVRIVRLPKKVSDAFTEILNAHRSGESVEEIAKRYDVTTTGVIAAVNYNEWSTSEDIDQTFKASNDPADDPEAQCDRQMALRIANRTLTQKQRKMLMGRFEGYTLVELAAQQGITTQAVSISQQHALKKLNIAHSATL